jgi:hypothetical protein
MIRTFPRQTAGDESFTISPTPFAVLNWNYPPKVNLGAAVLICGALLLEHCRHGGSGAHSRPLASYNGPEAACPEPPKSNV